MDQARKQRILRQHLLTDRLLGVEAVPISALPDQPDQSAAPVVSASPMSSAGYSAQGQSQSTGESYVPRQSSAANEPASISNPVVPKRRGKRMTVGDKAQLLKELAEQEVASCTACDLCKSRTQTVFGEGHPNADLLFIGEGPGQTEDEQGRPFCGRSGKLLDKQIEAIGLKREKVFIANVVKCRPPNNRTPLAPEVEACRHFLLRQIEIIQPKAIMTLGGPAAKLILGTKKGITTIRGTWYEFQVNDAIDPIPVMPTFHPAYLLRAYTVENRKKVWSDLQAVVKLLEG